MNQPDPQQEPTMEEILASIRRIISEEGEESDEGAAETAAEPAEASPPDEPAREDPAVEEPAVEEPAVEEPAVEEPAVEKPAVDDNVLELTEFVDDEAPALEEDEPEPAVEPEPELEPDEVVFKAEEEDAEPEPESAPALEPAPEPPFEPEPEPVFAAASDRGLVSEPVAVAAANTFADFGGAVQAARGLGMGNGNRTLEDIVKELLRPMLKEWLDANLASIVQRIVEREVVKLAGRADDGGGDLTDRA